MAHKKHDRRVERTQTALKTALVRLLHQQDYDSITIQDITEHANVGRTTFYLHYDSKDDLLLDHYAEMLEALEIGKWSREELLAKKEATGLIKYLDLMDKSRQFYQAILQAKDIDYLTRKMQDQLVANLRESLASAFPNQTARIPLSILCNYIAGAQLALIKWWMTDRKHHSSRVIAHSIQQLQFLAIADSYEIE